MAREREVLDALARRNADLRPGIVQRPLGTTGLHVVRRPGSTEDIIVGSLFPGQTWPPGSEVPLASYGSAPGYAIAGQPPVGQGGGTVFPQVHYFEAPVTSAPLAYLALTWDVAEEEVTASLYRNGTWEEDLATRAIAVGAIVEAQVIPADPLELVAPASVLYMELLGDLVGMRVWDTTANVVHEYAPGAGTLYSTALWVLGRIYWVEYPETIEAPAAATLSLRRATADFSTVETIATYAWAPFGGTATITLFSAPAAATDAAITVWMEWSGGETSGSATVRMPIAGGDVTEGSGSIAQSAISAGDRSVLAYPLEGFTSLATRLDTADAEYVTAWATTLEWANASVIGSSATLYGFESGAAKVARGPLLLGATSSFAVDAHPTLGVAPAYMWALE